MSRLRKYHSEVIADHREDESHETTISIVKTITREELKRSPKTMLNFSADVHQKSTGLTKLTGETSSVGPGYGKRILDSSATPGLVTAACPAGPGGERELVTAAGPAGPGGERELIAGYVRLRPDAPVAALVKLTDRSAANFPPTSEAAVTAAGCCKEHQLLKARQKERAFLLPERTEEIEFHKRCFIAKPRHGGSAKTKKTKPVRNVLDKNWKKKE